MTINTGKIADQMAGLGCGCLLASIMGGAAVIITAGAVWVVLRLFGVV